MRSPFRIPRTNRGMRQAEAAMVAAGIAMAILCVWLQLANRKTQPDLDRLGLLIEIVR